MARKGIKDSTSKLKIALEQMAKILTIGAAVIYASGFLIVSTFLDRFDLIGSGVEFLKVKYVLVGMLFVLFPCGVLAPLLIIFLYLREHRATKIKIPPIAAFNLLTVS